jgi:Uma2 family endonuclease
MTISNRFADTYRLMLQHHDALIELTALQGLWTQEQYLVLTDSTNLPVEYTDGDIEVLPMPTDLHQRLLLALYALFRAFVQPRGGVVMVASLRVQIREHKYREPDILLLQNARDPRRQNRFWLGADLVVEIVSQDDPERDTIDKVADYAEGNIPEYWIVNPINETIRVLVLEEDTYIVHGIFGRGTQAVSALLAGFEVDVAMLFDTE